MGTETYTQKELPFREEPRQSCQNEFERQLKKLGGSPKKLDTTLKSKRYNEGKPKLEYILNYPTVLEAFARVMELGAAKYGDNNWKLGNSPDEQYLNSAMRHIIAFKKGEIYDDDSGCPHIAHAIWNLCTLMQLNYPKEILNDEQFHKQCRKWEADERSTSD